MTEVAREEVGFGTAAAYETGVGGVGEWEGREESEGEGVRGGGERGRRGESARELEAEWEWEERERAGEGERVRGRVGVGRRGREREGEGERSGEGGEAKPGRRRPEAVEQEPRNLRTAHLSCCLPSRLLLLISCLPSRLPCRLSLSFFTGQRRSKRERRGEKLSALGWRQLTVAQVAARAYCLWLGRTRAERRRQPFLPRRVPHLAKLDHLQQLWRSTAGPERKRKPCGPSGGRSQALQR